MNYILNDDYSIQKVSKVTKKNTKNMKYLLLDISTARKGPLYTLVEDVNLSFNDDKWIDIAMDVSYAGVDVPCDDCTMLTTSFSTNTIERYYNIFPLIKQMLTFNTFREKNSNIDNQLFIETIQFQYGKESVYINEYDSDQTINKLFRKLKMRTAVDQILSDDEILLIYDNHWELASLSNEFDTAHLNKIGISVPSTESIYLLSYTDFSYFLYLNSISVEIGYPETDDIEESEYCILNANSIKEILELCIFIPQMVLLEQQIYGNAIRLTIHVETDYGKRSLLIDEKETPFAKNMCIFILIKKLLKM